MAANVGLPVLEIGEVIRLAVAPVFLLSGVGITLTLLVNRLARVIDRARALEDDESQSHPHGRADLEARLSTLTVRARLLGRAIALSTICALLVSMVVVTLFIGALFEIRVGLVIAAEFVVAMFSLIGALLYFLREVFLATRTLRIGLRHST
jgi:Protein of unknown function (DUF2721)